MDHRLVDHVRCLTLSVAHIGPSSRVSQTRLIPGLALALAALLLLSACATAPQVTPEIRADLAPTGKLRAAINAGNALLAAKDKTTGELRGVAVDLAHDIGRRLGVPVEFVTFKNVATMGDAAPTGKWDIAFLGSDPQRESLMSFTPAYLEIDATYLVAGSSPLRTIADVDRKGVRIAAPARANYELFLRRNLKEAELVSPQDINAAFKLLQAGKVDTLASLKQNLLNRSKGLPGSRVLEGRFMAVQQSIAVPKGHDAGLAYLRYVAEEAKSSGLVARAIEKTGYQGVSVAPPAR